MGNQRKFPRARQALYAVFFLQRGTLRRARRCVNEGKRRATSGVLCALPCLVLGKSARKVVRNARVERAVGAGEEVEYVHVMLRWRNLLIHRNSMPTSPLPAFYRELTKIAATRAQRHSEERKTQERMNRAARSVALGGAIGGAAGVGVRSASSRGVMRSLQGHGDTSPQEAAILRAYAPTVQQHNNVADLLDAAELGPGDRASFENLANNNAFSLDLREYGKGAHTYAPPTAHPSIMAHEIGHLAGSKVYNNKLQPVLSALHGKAPMVVFLGALGGAGIAGAHRDPEDRNKWYRGAQGATAATSLLSAPVLLEEARASLHAVNMGRKVGKGLEYARHLLPAWATYAAPVIGVTGGTLGALEFLRRRANKKAARGR